MKRKLDGSESMTVYELLFGTEVAFRDCESYEEKASDINEVINEWLFTNRDFDDEYFDTIDDGICAEGCGCTLYAYLKVIQYLQSIDVI